MIIQCKELRWYHCSLKRLCTSYCFRLKGKLGGCAKVVPNALDPVANYCRDHVHLALEEEMKVTKQETIKGTYMRPCRFEGRKSSPNGSRKSAMKLEEKQADMFITYYSYKLWLQKKAMWH